MINFKEKYLNYKEKINSSKKEKTRFFMLLMGTIFFMNFLMVSYHIDNNIFNIFPSIPVFSDNKEINIYLPSLDAKEMLSEKRIAPNFKDDSNYIKYLFKMVVKGSNFENTSIIVPVKIFIKKIWITGSNDNQKCILDIETSEIPPEIEVIAGSEKIFKLALKKTIIKNIPNIKDIKILIYGIPNKKIWEIGSL